MLISCTTFVVFAKTEQSHMCGPSCIWTLKSPHHYASPFCVTGYPWYATIINVDGMHVLPAPTYQAKKLLN